MNKKGSIGILGVLIIVAVIFFLFKFPWLLIIGGALLLLFIVMLIKASKNSENEASDLDAQVRNALSKIRQQKFKAEAKINRLKEWTNDAIETTYGSLFGEKFFRTELYEKYPEIKAAYSEKITPAQVEKTEMIVNGYINHIKTEQIKIETLDHLQKEHEELRGKLKNAKKIQRTGKKLDKHVDRLKDTGNDLSAEETIIKADYTYDDLKQEVEMNNEYVKQLFFYYRLEW